MGQVDFLEVSRGTADSPQIEGSSGPDERERGASEWREALVLQKAEPEGHARCDELEKADLRERQTTSRPRE